MLYVITVASSIIKMKSCLLIPHFQSEKTEVVKLGVSPQIQEQFHKQLLYWKGAAYLLS